MVEREADRALAAMGLADAPRFSVPTPLNTLLWRAVAMTPDGYVEGFRSQAADVGPMVFQGNCSNKQEMAETQDITPERRLARVEHGVMQTGGESGREKGGENE